MFQPHSETSKIAYQRLENENSQCDEIISLLRNRGAMTGSELADYMKLPIGTVSARVAYLVESGELVRSALTRVHKGRSGTLIYTKAEADKLNVPVLRKKENNIYEKVRYALDIINQEMDVDGTLSKLTIRRVQTILNEALK